MEKNLFIYYPKCSTCQKAKKWLENNDIKFIQRHIVEDTPTKEELMEWIKKSGYPIKKFFNTSGNIYKELNLKDKLEVMSQDEKLNLLANEGMLIKRPLFITEDYVFVGFKEEIWSNIKR